MTDLPNQNPVQTGQNSIPSNQTPAQPATVSPAAAPLPIKNQPVSEPPVPAWTGTENPPQSETNPIQPTVETPTVSQSPNNKKKILTIGVVILVIVFLTAAVYLSLSFLNKKGVKKTASKPEGPLRETPTKLAAKPRVPVQLPAEPIIEKKGDFVLSVNDEVFSWKEYEDFLNYSLKQTKSNVNDSKVREEINNSLIERLLLISTIDELGITVSNGEIEKFAEDLYCFSDNKCDVSEKFKNNPHTKDLVEGLLYKQKIIENLVDWVNGGYVLVRAGSREIKQAASEKSMEAKTLARQTITPYYEKAKNGQAIENLITEVKKDPQIKEFNSGESQPFLLETYTRKPNPPKQPYWEDPQFVERVFSLSQDKTSDIFILKVPNNREKNTWADYGYVFIKVEEVSQGQFDTYQDWFDSALNQAEIISNL